VGYPLPFASSQRFPGVIEIPFQIERMV